MISAGVGGHARLKSRDKKILQSSKCGRSEKLCFLCVCALRGVKSTLCTGGRLQFVDESSILLKLQVCWVYTGNFTQFISLFGLKYNKEGRSPQHLVPHPLLIPQQLP